MGREKGAVVAGGGVAVDVDADRRACAVVPWGRAVVPFHSRSYFGVLLTYDRAGSGTTARRNVRPRASGYDRAGLPTTARPIRARPARGARSDARRRASSPACRVVPSSSTFRDESDDAAVGLVQECPSRGPGSRARRPRTDLGAELNRSRCGTEPISARGTGRATPAGPGITTDRDVSSQFPVGWDARPRRGRPPARRRAPARIIPIDEGALHAGSCREGL